jgi:hypothetical protein
MCTTCDWSEWVEVVDELLESERYEFASTYLESVREWIVKNSHVTSAQTTAIENIREGARP